MGIGHGVARLIETDLQARLNAQPIVKVTPGNWVYVLTKVEIAFIQSTGTKLDKIDTLYFYDDRYIFIKNWKLNGMLCRVSDTVTTEYNDNLDIPFNEIPDVNSFEDLYFTFDPKVLKAGDLIVGLDEADDVVVFQVL